MRRFSDYNPIAVAVYFLCAAGTVMFSMNPVIILLSLIGAVVLLVTRNGSRERGCLLSLAAAFVILALINPIFSHNGVTVLFVLNDIPFTFGRNIAKAGADFFNGASLCPALSETSGKGKKCAESTRIV